MASDFTGLVVDGPLGGLQRQEPTSYFSVTSDDGTVTHYHHTEMRIGDHRFPVWISEARFMDEKDAWHFLCQSFAWFAGHVYGFTGDEVEEPPL